MRELQGGSITTSFIESYEAKATADCSGTRDVTVTASHQGIPSTRSYTWLNKAKTKRFLNSFVACGVTDALHAPRRAAEPIDYGEYDTSGAAPLSRERRV